MRSFYAEGAPPMLRLAALVQGLEAVGLLAAAVAQAVEAATGHSYQASSGVALAVFELIIAVGLALIARAIARLRPWSRTPAVMTQLCCGVLGIILVQADQVAFGVPLLVLAVLGLVALLNPASLKALRREIGGPAEAAPAKGAPAKGAPAKGAAPKSAARKPGAPEPGAPKPGVARATGAKSTTAKSGGAREGAAKPAKGNAARQPRAN